MWFSLGSFTFRLDDDSSVTGLRFISNILNLLIQVSILVNSNSLKFVFLKQNFKFDACKPRKLVLKKFYILVIWFSLNQISCILKIFFNINGSNKKL